MFIKDSANDYYELQHFDQLHVSESSLGWQIYLIKLGTGGVMQPLADIYTSQAAAQAALDAMVEPHVA